MRWWIIFMLLATDVAAADGQYDAKLINSHTGGLNTYFSPNRLKDDESPEIINAYIDKDQAVVKRNGYIVNGTVPNCTSNIRMGTDYLAPGGQEFSMVACSSQVYSTTGNGSFTAVGSTISATQSIYSKVTLGNIYFNDGTDPLWYFNGTSTAVVTGAVNTSVPLCQLVAGYQSRLVQADCGGAASTVWLSGYNNPGDYYLSPPVAGVVVDTSAVEFFLNGPNDGRSITCIYDGFQNQLIIWNQNQMFQLTGSGAQSFVLRILNQDVGCIDQNSVQEYDGKLYWVSGRGMEQYDGALVRRVSLPIQNLFDQIIGTKKTQTTLTQSGATLTSGNPLAAGPGAPMSTTIVSGDVVPSTWGVTINGNDTGVDWASSFWVSTMVIPGWTTQAVSTFAFPNGDFRQGNFTNWTQQGSWSLTGPSTYASSCNPQSSATGYFALTPSQSLNGAQTSTLQLLDNNNNVLNSCTFTYTWPGLGCSFTSTTCPISQSVTGGGQTVGLFTPANETLTAIKVIDPVGNYIQSITTTSAITASVETACAVEPSHVFFITGCNNQYYMGGGQVVYNTYDTSFSTPVWGNASAVILSSSAFNDFNFNIQVANASGGPFDSGINIMNGSQLTNASKRYVKATANFYDGEAGNTTVATVGFQSLNLSAATTGQFMSTCFNPGTFNSWGNFLANTIPNGGSFSFQVSTGPTCNSVEVATAPWTTQTNATVIGVATAPYLGVLTTFNLTNASQQPTLQNLNITFTNGSGRPPLASTVYQQRYWLAFTTNTSPSAYNDTIIVRDIFQHFTMFKDIDAGALWNFNNSLYSADSTGTGNVYQQDTGYTDNGGPIWFEFKTPFYDGDYVGFKTLRSIKTDLLAVTNPALAGPLTVNYYMNLSTVPYSMGVIYSSGTVGGRFTGSFIDEKKYATQNANPSTGYNFQVEYTNNSVTPVTLYRTLLQWMPYKERD